MKPGQQNIIDFLSAIRALGVPDGVVMQGQQWDRAAMTRRLFGARSIETRPKKDFSQEGQAPPEVEPDAGWTQQKGRLVLGQLLAIRLSSEIDGYLALFNFGTSGTCAELGAFRNNNTGWIEADQMIKVPEGEEEAFSVDPPASADRAVDIERLFAVVCRRCKIHLPDLGFGLLPRESTAGTARSGFVGPIPDSTPALFRMPTEEWTWGLLEWTVDSK